MMNGRRLAEEAQLLAEEKWTIAAWKNIRNHQNAIKIERLQMESLLAAERCKKQPQIAPDTNKGTTTEPGPTLVSTIDLNNELLDTFTSSKNLNAENTETLDKGDCNFEKLDLNITESIFSLNDPMQFGLDIEEDEDEDVSDDENITVDVNMLINAEYDNDKEK